MTYKSTTHEELYFHIREPHTDKKGKRYKAATAFVRCNDSIKNVADEAFMFDSVTYCVSIARCSAEDNFNRAQGRTIAKRRFYRGDISQYNVDKPTFDSIKALYQSI